MSQCSCACETYCADLDVHGRERVLHDAITAWVAILELRGRSSIRSNTRKGLPGGSTEELFTFPGWNAVDKLAFNVGLVRLLHGKVARSGENPYNDKCERVQCRITPCHAVHKRRGLFNVSIRTEIVWFALLVS